MRGTLERGRRDVQEIEILGRTLRWTEKGLEYEAGNALNDESKTVNSAAMEEELSQDEDEKIFGAEEARHHMSLDRSDAPCAAKEVCRKMTNPTWRSWNRH